MLFNRLIPPTGFYPYAVNYGARFNGTADYLHRTFATSSRQRFVFATWFKKVIENTTVAQAILTGWVADGDRTSVLFNNDGQVVLYGQSGSVNTVNDIFSPRFRDDSNWVHIVVSADTTEATASNRCRLWVNGIEVTDKNQAVTIPQNENLYIGHSVSHRIADMDAATKARPFTGYLSEMVFLQGLSIQNGDAAVGDFGQFVKNVWTPKKISSNAWSGYGSESFYFEFKDTGTTGKNSIGGGSDWSESGTVYHPSDTPTNNQAIFTRIEPTSLMEIYNANVNMHAPSFGWASARASIPFPSSGKYYFQGYASAYGPSSKALAVGIAEGTNCDDWFWNTSARKSISYAADGCFREQNGGVVGTDNYATWTAAEKVSLCVDMDAKEITFSVNGVEQLTHDFSDWTEFENIFLYVSSIETTSIFTAQFYSDEYAPPGYKILSSVNFPEPETNDARKGFWNPLWDGNGTAQDITGATFPVDQSSLVWLKCRDVTYSHNLQDTVRGSGVILQTDLTVAEAAAGNRITSFNSDGFSIGNSAAVNNSGSPFVAWVFNMIARFGMDIVTYTGNAVAGRTVAHNLGAEPNLIIVKNRDRVVTWRVYHSDYGPTGYFKLDTAGFTTATNCWNDTAPTSSVFSVGTADATNYNGENHVAYLFRNVPGFLKVGTFVGNGSADGPFVNCGFRPRFLLYKCANAGYNWNLYDAARDTYNVADHYLGATTYDAEIHYDAVDFLSTGFKMRYSLADGVDNIFLAIGDQPFKYSNAR